jgi:glucosamine--fructose-6-phosphate aminotransferase (isomerizing)
VVSRFLSHNAAALAQLPEPLRATPPSLVVTCARGQRISRDLCQISGRDRPWRALRLGGFLTVSLYDAPVVTSGEGALCQRHLAIGPQPRHALHRRAAEGLGRAGRGAGQ